MIVITKEKATPQEIQHIKDRIESYDCQIHESAGKTHLIFGVIGDVRRIDTGQLERMAGVDRVVRIMRPYKLAGRDFHPQDTLIQVGQVTIGGPKLTVMAGPCAVESREQIIEVAQKVKASGANILRGGAFKPRTSPYSFQGLKEEGLIFLAEAREKTGLPIITEVVDVASLPLVADYADILQVGARNAQNFTLLKAIGELEIPVLIKRGMMSTIEELLMSAEYVLSKGNQNVILCERGIRTFEKYTRNTFDLSAIPLLKQLSHLPVIADPSHGTGLWELVSPTTLGAVAAGADGLIVEVHPDPEIAVSDGRQSLKPNRFGDLMQALQPVAQAVGRKL